MGGARLEVTPVRLALRTPLVAAWGELRERELLRVRLAWPDDDVGVGEAAPLEPYDGVSLGAVARRAGRVRELLRGADRARRTPTCSRRARRSARCPQALAAIDLALWDRAGRRTGRPVAPLLAPGAAAAVPVNATLGAEDRAGAAAQAAAAVGRRLRLREGQGRRRGRRRPARRGAGRRRAGRGDPGGRERRLVDAAEAVANLRALAATGLEYAEEPVHGVEALRAVRSAGVARVAMDETAAAAGRRRGGRRGRGLPQDRPLRRDHRA